jgi:hypothetical protein
MDDFPELLKLWLRRKDYELLYTTFRQMSDDRATYYLRSQAGAIKAVKENYEKLFGVKPYGNMATHLKWDAEIAKYCHVLGAKRLIDDMRIVWQACAKPESIIYFLYRKDGQACRWDRLMTDEAERRAKADRETRTLSKTEAADILKKIKERMDGETG